MKRAVSAFAVAAIGLWSAGVFAQGRNFGGTWTVDAEKTMAASLADLERRTEVTTGGGGGGGAVARGGGGGGGGRGRAAAGPMTITLDANTFSFGSGETSTVYRLDGTPSVTETPGGKATSKASWKDDKLTIETLTDSSNGQVATTVVWYLEGESLVRETQTTFNGVASTRKTFFKRS